MANEPEDPNALRFDLIDRKLDRLIERIDRLAESLGFTERRQIEMSSRMDRLAAALDRIESTYMRAELARLDRQFTAQRDAPD